MEVTSVSKEIDCASAVPTPWGPGGSAVQVDLVKGERGRRAGHAARWPWLQDASKAEPQGGTDADPPAKPRTRGRALRGVHEPLRGRLGSSRARLKPRGTRRPRGRTAPRRERGPEGKPQERDRDETSPAGRAGSKASRGCETLRAQPDRWVGSCRIVWLRAAGKTLKGTKPRTGRGGRWCFGTTVGPRSVAPVKLCREARA